MLFVLISLFFASSAFAAETPDKKGILLVSFGTSMPEATGAIEALTRATEEAFPDVPVRIAYTSNIIRRKLKREQNISIPTPAEALAALNDEGFTHVAVQPMHIIPGEEYDEVKGVVDAFASIQGKYGFQRLLIGRPFLSNAEDCAVMAGILKRRFEGRTGKTVVLMGHGTPHMANAMYSELQLAISRAAGEGKIVLGTVEAGPSFDDVLATLKKARGKRLVLAPFMIVAGDHANNDLADPDDPESWLSRFKKEGYTVETDLVGLGQYPEIAKLFVNHVAELLKQVR
ncbi:MAG: sirohydrochlorin cobaltochelatase [Synergistaceae bacterium]|jgi:sirohydrochlorin cobaltochelatase|nr:sirohydrochlorin cobaltochelatase [Synergistaceae bacterium]